MRPVRLLPLLLLAALLGGCYQTDGPTVAQGVKIETLKDGVWRRSDGSTLRLWWDAGSNAYAVASGGHVRLEPAGPLWLADYQAERNVVMLARVTTDTVELLQPSPAAEQRLAATHALTVRPGPVNRLSGDAAARRHYLAELAALDGSPDLVVAERLSRVNP